MCSSAFAQRLNQAVNASTLGATDRARRWQVVPRVLHASEDAGPELQTTDHQHRSVSRSWRDVLCIVAQQLFHAPSTSSVMVVVEAT